VEKREGLTPQIPTQIILLDDSDDLKMDEIEVEVLQIIQTELSDNKLQIYKNL
jgi:hypothetical protein